MLYLFDMDGTLITGYMDNPDRDYNTWQLLPGRRETIAALVSEGHQIGIVTNQAGVAFGFVTADAAREKFQAVAAALGYGGIALHDCADGDPRYAHWTTGNELPITRRELPIFVCYADARATRRGYADPADVARRKPSGRMIAEAVQDAQIDYYDSETEMFADVPVLFVGDRPEDGQAAADAGVAFQWAAEFFRESE